MADHKYPPGYIPLTLHQIGGHNELNRGQGGESRSNSRGPRSQQHGSSRSRGGEGRRNHRGGQDRDRSANNGNGHYEGSRGRGRGGSGGGGGGNGGGGGENRGNRYRGDRNDRGGRPDRNDRGGRDFRPDSRNAAGGEGRERPGAGEDEETQFNKLPPTAPGQNNGEWSDDDGDDQE